MEWLLLEWLKHVACGVRWSPRLSQGRLWLNADDAVAWGPRGHLLGWAGVLLCAGLHSVLSLAGAPTYVWRWGCLQWSKSDHQSRGLGFDVNQTAYMWVNLSLSPPRPTGFYEFMTKTTSDKNNYSWKRLWRLLWLGNDGAMPFSELFPKLILSSFKRKRSKLTHDIFYTVWYFLIKMPLDKPCKDPLMRTR